MTSQESKILKKENSLKKYFVFLGAGITLSLLVGCVKIDLGSGGDTAKLYDISLSLDEVQEISKLEASKSHNKNIGLQVSASNIFDSTSIYILDENTKEINTLGTSRWITKPKNMLQTSMSNLMQKNGINVTNTPISSNDFRILKISIEKFLIRKRGSTYYVQISLKYEYVNMGTNKILESGFISKSSEVKLSEFALTFMNLSKSALEEIVIKL